MEAERFQLQPALAAEQNARVHLIKMDGPGFKQIHRDLPVKTDQTDAELDCTGDLEKMNFRWLNTQPLEYAYASSEAHWIAALLGRVPMLPTAQLALDTLLIQDGIRLSSQLGREVTAEETIAASVSTAAAI
mgnify:CR=1 FL=1